MTPTTCLASTGFSALTMLLVAAAAVALGLLVLRSHRSRIVLLVLVIAGATLTLGLSTAKPAGAACVPESATTTTTAPAALSALQLGVNYLVSEFQPDGSVMSYGVESPGMTVQTVIALAESGVTTPSVENAMTAGANYLAGNVDNFVVLSPTSSPSWGDLCAPRTVNYVPTSPEDSAMNLAYLLIAAIVTHNAALVADESSFVSRILATQQSSTGTDPYYFGTCVNQWAGTQSQAVVISALILDGMSTSNPVLTNAVSWLDAQQCSGGGTALNGAFSSDIVDNPCASGTRGTGNYQGPDTNSTAYALMALAAMGETASSPVVAAALTNLQDTEFSPSSWGYYVGNTSDGGSTAVVINGLNAFGISTTSNSGTWALGGVSPAASEASFQVTTPGSQQGGFFYQTGSLPDPQTSYAAVLALSGAKDPA